MEMRNCSKCHRVFGSENGISVCQVCFRDLEVKFKRVKNYIRENHGASIFEVSELCEVEAHQINQWIKEERLYLAEDSGITIACEKCGARIRIGRYCNQCKTLLVKDLKQAYSQPPLRDHHIHKDHEDKTKMRYLNQDKDKN
ncbi:MAG: flagellar protein [Firmicutes bacterium HGW-Firmicutes-7]|nr:MAG: flagellar protein [Firmicutes bacterium HGW-Firmicutes-7]